MKDGLKDLRFKRTIKLLVIPKSDCNKLDFRKIAIYEKMDSIFEI